MEAGVATAACRCRTRRHDPALATRNPAPCGSIASCSRISTPTISTVVPDLWLTGWLPPVWAGARKTAFRVIGPTGAKNLMDETRLKLIRPTSISGSSDEKVPPQGIRSMSRNSTATASIYEHDGLKVTAFEVDHGDASSLASAIGSIIADARRCCRATPATTKMSSVRRGADLLVHEVMAVHPALLEEPGIAISWPTTRARRMPVACSPRPARNSPPILIWSCSASPRVRH